MIRNLYLALVRNKHHVSFIFALILSFSLLLTKDIPGVIYLRQVSIDFVQWISAPITKLKSLRAVEEENALLREKNMQYSLQFQELYSLETENRQLRSMLSFQREKELEMIASKVINKGTEPGLESILIDVGSSDGVQVDFPVVMPEGLVGKTILVGESTSLVQLISDVNFRISVRILPSGATGILRWNGDDQCEVREVHANLEINAGDQIVSSGYSNIYPPNMAIGTVTEVMRKRGSFQQSVTAKVSSQLGALMNVFVIINE
jgi:rod shape-determining protein MreC